VSRAKRIAIATAGGLLLAACGAALDPMLPDVDTRALLDRAGRDLRDPDRARPACEAVAWTYLLHGTVDASIACVQRRDGLDPVVVAFVGWLRAVPGASDPLPRLLSEADPLVAVQVAEALGQEPPCDPIAPLQPALALEAGELSARSRTSLTAAQPPQNREPREREALRRFGRGACGRVDVPAAGVGPRRVYIDTSNLPRRGVLRIRASVPARLAIDRAWAGEALLPGEARHVVLDPPLDDKASGSASDLALLIAAEGGQAWVEITRHDDLPRHTASPTPAEALSARERVTATARSALTDTPLDAIARAERLLERYPRSPLLHLLAAKAHLARPQPDRGKARAHLDALLDIDPRGATALTMRAALARDDTDLDLAERLVRRSLALQRSVEARALNALVLRERGLGDEALAELRALAKEPGASCARLADLLDLGAEHGRAGLAETADAASKRCPGLEAGIGQAYGALGRVSDARRVLERRAQRPGSRREATLELAALDAAAGRSADAKARLRRFLESDPGDGEVAFRLADLAASASDATAAATWLARALIDSRDEPEVRRRALRLGASPPWGRYTRDATVLAKEPLPEALTRGASAVWLLDQEIDVFLPGGGLLRRVHIATKLLDAKVAGDYGELKPSDDAEVLHARTIKADGRVIEAEDTPDKGSVSLSDLEAGDVIDYEYIVVVSANDRPSLATRGDTFHFGLAEGPTRLCEYIVLSPPSLAIDVEASASCPAPERSHDAGFDVIAWRARDLAHLRPEPNAQQPDRVFPNVRVGSRAGLDALLGAWDEALAAALADPDDRIAAFTRRLAPPSIATEAQLAALLQKVTRAVFERVEQDDSGGAFGSAAPALARGRGDRATVLLAALRRLGVDVTLVRLTSPQAPVVSARLATPGAYPLTALRVRAPGRDLWIDPLTDRPSVDYLRPALQGRAGLLIDPTGRASVDRAGRVSFAERAVTTPVTGLAPERRRVTWRLSWTSDGAIEGQGEETFSGLFALALRRIGRSPKADDRTALLDQLASLYLPGARLVDVVFDGLEDFEAEVTLRYRIVAPADPARAQALDLGLVPELLAQTFATLSSRRTPLLVGVAIRTELRVEIAGAKGVATPAAIAVDVGPLKYRRAARVIGATLAVDRDLDVTFAAVQPSAYPAFAAAARRIDAADRLRIERPRPAGAP